MALTGLYDTRPNRIYLVCRMPLSCLLSMVRSFVVQFHAGTNLGERRLGGRVEHLRTGDTAHFESLDDLLLFMETHIEADRDLAPGNPQVEEYQK